MLGLSYLTEENTMVKIEKAENYELHIAEVDNATWLGASDQGHVAYCPFTPSTYEYFVGQQTTAQSSCMRAERSVATRF